MKFYLIELATDFYRQPSYSLSERASFNEYQLKCKKWRQVMWSDVLFDPMDGLEGYCDVSPSK